MSELQIGWGLCLLVVLTSLPVGLVRWAAYRSGDTPQGAPLRIALVLSLAIAALGLVGLAVTSVLLVL